LEDLGKIYVMLDNLMEHHLFQESRMNSKKFPEWFMEQERVRQIEILDRYASGVDEIEEALYDIREIARGEDA